MPVPELDAVVVGAGIAGLAAALELQSAGCDVLVVDPSDRPGGVMRTDHRAGFVVESGPNTTLVKAPMLSFLERRHLAETLLPATPDSRLRFLYRKGELVPAPASPLALLRTPLLSGRAKLSLLAEPFRRRGAGAEESVAEFVGRRLGPEVLRELVGPFLTGVYAGDESELGAASVFPGLVELEERGGSLAAGALASLFRRRGKRGLRGSHSTEQGFGPFARRLAEALHEPPALGSRVSGLVRDDGRWRVEVASPGGDRTLSAARVVIAAPAFDAGTLLRAVDAEVAEQLEAVEYAPIVAAPVGIDPSHARRPIEGFGFLVPKEEGLGLLGCLFMSRLFPGRAPVGHELLHCMLGGVRWPEAVELPDDVLEQRLAEELETTLGLEGPVQSLALARWPRAVPQPDRHHAARMAWVASRLREKPGLALAGAYVAGVSVSDSLASGVDAAAWVLEAVPIA